MKNLTVTQSTAMYFAAGGFGFMCFEKGFAGLGAFAAGCLLTGFIAWLERAREDRYDKLRAEITEVRNSVESVLLNKAIRRER